MSKDKRTIAFLDDRKAQRETVIRGLRGAIPDGWECVECPLHPTTSQYSAWLLKNGVVVLVVDQLLNEQAADSELPVDYKGHDVIAAVRSHIPQFPIMVVTRATEDPDLTDHLGEADDIVSRADLLKDAGKYVARFVRHGMRYLEEHEKELAALADLSSKAASGSLTAAEIQKMKAIQTKLRLAASQSNERDRALQLLEKEVAGLGKIRNKLEKFLGEVGKKAAPKPAKKKPPKGSRKK